MFRKLFGKYRFLTYFVLCANTLLVVLWNSIKIICQKTWTYINWSDNKYIKKAQKQIMIKESIRCKHQNMKKSWSRIFYSKALIKELFWHALRNRHGKLWQEIAITFTYKKSLWLLLKAKKIVMVYMVTC